MINSLFMKADLLFNICYYTILYSVYAGMKHDLESSNGLLRKVELHEVFHFQECSDSIKIISSSSYLVWQENSIRKKKRKEKRRELTERYEREQSILSLKARSEIQKNLNRISFQSELMSIVTRSSVLLFLCCSPYYL